MGVLGIGYPSNEVQVAQTDLGTYPNLPKAMVKQGLIKSNAYSLWLNDLAANTGSILFGGVDAAKYHGELKILPVQKVNGGYSQLVIALTGLTLSAKSSHHNYSSKALPTAVLLDSGSTLTYLPDSLVNDIYKDLGVVYEQSTAAGFVPCSLAQSSVNMTYTFSSPEITVGADELVIDIGNLSFQDGTPACLFGIAPSGNGPAVLGDTFLRSAYVVYDLANNEIALASTNFNSRGSDVHEIGTGRDAIPGATRVKNPVTSVTFGGFGARIGAPSGPSTQLPSHAAATTPYTGTEGYLAVSLVLSWLFMA